MIKTREGRRILIDPFDSSIGYNTDFPKCDLITISHTHFDHSFINEVNTHTQIINSFGTFDFEFLKLKGVKSFHDDFNGLKRGPNIIYIFKFPEMSIAHLGDLGCIPDESILAELNSLDFLIIPTGSNFTLNGEQASKLCKLLMPRYIIPMHYKTPLTNLKLSNCKDFILSMKKINKIKSNILDLSSFDLNDNYMEVLFLKPPHLLS